MTITIISAYYGSVWQGDWTIGFNALQKLSWTANNNKSYSFAYMPGRDVNNNGYDPHGGQGKNLTVNYICGIGGISSGGIKTVVGGEGRNVTIQCP